MAKWKPRGQINIYEKEKPQWGAVIFWCVVALIIIGALAN